MNDTNHTDYNEIHYHGGIDMCRADFEGSSALCAKAVIFSILAFLTALACIVKGVRIYLGVTVEKYHLIVFALAATECIVLTVHWAYVGKIQLHFLALYLLVNEFLVLCVFYGGLAVKVFNHKLFLERVYYPVAGVLFLYFTGVLGYSFYDVYPNREECLQPQWLLFSASELALAQLMLVSGIFLTQAMNRVTHIDRKYLNTKKKILWSLIIVFEMASIYNFSYDLALKVDPEENHCDTLFGAPNTARFIFATWLQLAVGYLLPVWVMLVVLKPTTRHRKGPEFEFETTSEEEDGLSHPLEERLLTSQSANDHNTSY